MASEQPKTEASSTEEPLALRAERLAKIFEQSNRISAAFWERQSKSMQQGEFELTDPVAVGRAFGAFAAALWNDPQTWAEKATEYWRQSSEIWETTRRMLHGEPIESPGAGPPDRRFRSAEWEENALFDHLRRSYLFASQWTQDLIRDTHGVESEDREKVAFYTRQLLSALSPSNSALTNPDVIKATMESDGENLIRGLENMLTDLERGRGELRISMTDEKAFEVGKNVATTPGKVVFQNDMMQLIQYAPLTKTVARRPLLVVPPWINKYYVMDMQPKNSLLRWMVEQGHTVFVISWVNPTEKLAHKTFTDYMHEGPLAAMNAIRTITGEEELNLLGFCIGGILCAVTLAWLAAQNDQRIASATFLATLFDFRDVGEAGVFIDEGEVTRIERYTAERGYLEGKHMMRMFSMMRENDLIWSFVVNNYLMGRSPMPFDLLYWNADSTHLPAAMLAEYLRTFYLDNALTRPGTMTIDDVPIDLTDVKTPCYVLATQDDHIAPWRSSYPGTRLIDGPVRFVLGGSGHIAGVINPPSAKKYRYWTNRATPGDPDTWLESATAHEGSWWTDWGKWARKHTGGKVDARKPGNAKLKPIEDAPGSYVQVRVTE